MVNQNKIGRLWLTGMDHMDILDMYDYENCVCTCIDLKVRLCDINKNPDLDYLVFSFWAMFIQVRAVLIPAQRCPSRAPASSL